MADATVDEKMKAAMETVVSNVVLGALEPETRDGILRECVLKFLNSWDFKSPMQKALEDRTRKLAVEVLESGFYDDLLRNALRAGFEQMIQAVPQAAAAAIKRAIFGVKGKDCYSTEAGLILKMLD